MKKTVTNIIAAIVVAVICAFGICKVADHNQKKAQDESFKTALEEAISNANRQRDARLLKKIQAEGLEPYEKISCLNDNIYQYYSVEERNNGLVTLRQLLVDTNSYEPSWVLTSGYFYFGDDFPTLHGRAKIYTVYGTNGSVTVIL